MKINLDNQIALVTGSAQGIGQAIANQLAANGAHVVFSDLSVDTAAASADACASAKTSALQLDVTNREQVAAGVEQIVADHGRLDILVNNAGINVLKNRVNIDTYPAEDWDRVVQTDLTGVYNVSHAATKPMVAQGSGRVVNIASVLGVVPARLQCAFTAAKAGVVNLTRAMALELAANGILVNCIAPGSTLTEATKTLFYSDDAVMQERADRMLSHIPLGRPGTVDEIAQGVLFFADPDNGYTTGQILSVDGGWTAGGFMRDF